MFPTLIILQKRDIDMESNNKIKTHNYHNVKTDH